MKTAIFIPVIATAVLLASAGLALAQVDVSAGVGASGNVNAGGANVQADAALEARMSTGKDHADKEIDRRIEMLNELNTRIQAMKHVSAEEEMSISALVSGQISSLTALKAKIQADTDLETLKADIQSIAQSYRIFVLVIPRAEIDVAAGKINTAAVAFTSLAAKLEVRIAGATGDSSSATSSLADMNAKVADAKVQSDAAVAAVATLQPDNGDKTIQTSNNAALKDARAKIAAANKDLKAAKDDAHAIVKWLHEVGASTNASASSSASVNQ